MMPYQISARLGYNLHVGVDQVTDRFDLTFKLGVDWAERIFVRLKKLKFDYTIEGDYQRVWRLIYTSYQDLRF